MVFLTLTSQRTYYPLTGCKGSNFLFNDKANDLFFSHFVPKTDFESNKKSITIAFIFVVEDKSCLLVIVRITKLYIRANGKRSCCIDRGITETRWNRSLRLETFLS